MSYAFSLADMRTYLSYLRTKKQEVLFDQAADEAEEEGEEEEDDTDFDPRNERKNDDMEQTDDADTM